MSATSMFTGVFPFGVGHTLFRTSSSVLYAIYLDSTSFVRMMKTTNNGTSWTQMDSAHVVQGYDSGIGSPSTWSAQIDSTGKIHVIYPSTLTVYKEIIFNTATDLWTTAVTCLTLTTAVNQTATAIAIDKNDYPHIAVISQQGATFNSYYANKVGGSWNASVAFDANTANTQFIDIIVENNNIPIIGANITGTFWAYNGNVNNATSFTKNQVSTTSAGSGSTQMSLAQDDQNNTWFAYAAVTTSYTTLQKHIDGDPWSTWSSSTTNSVAGYRNRITVAGRNVYTFSQSGSTNSNIQVNNYNGVFWAGITTLDSGSYNTVHPRYANRNMFSPSTVDYMFNGPSTTFYMDTMTGSDTTVIYYFDGSDAAATDPNTAWSSDANAFDGNLTTAATQTTTSSQSSGFLKAEGTNATATGGPITQVRARVYGKGSSDGSASYGSYTTLSAPTGGWTWTKLDALEVQIDTNAAASGTAALIHAVVYTDSLAENLGTATYTSASNAPQTMSVYRVELEVTYAAFVTYTPSHSTDASKKIVPNSTHTTDGNKRKATTRTHTTSAVKRKQFAITHTTSANKRVSGFTKTHTTDSNKKKTGNTVSFTTDALKRKQNTLFHTTDANKKRASITATHTTDANKKKSGVSVNHTTDALKRVLVTKTHTTDALKRIQNIKTHTTDALKRKQFAITHTTDALKRKTNTRTHTTDTLVRKQNTKFHTTDANKKKTTTVTHTTDGLKRGQYTKTHTTDSFLRKQNTRTHTTDSNKRKTGTISHTTSANKRVANLLKTHTTDANKRKSGVTKTHTTDSLLRKQFTKTHSTDANKRIAALTRTHTTDSNKRKTNTRQHTTDANKRTAGLLRSHTTDANKRKALSATHTTDGFIQPSYGSLCTDYFDATFVPVIVVYTTSHSTDAVKSKRGTQSHTTDALKRTQNTLSHTTDANKRKTLTKTHTTDSFLRRQITKAHTTDALKRTQNVKTHSTDALKRAQTAKIHTTDALKRKQNVKFHTTDAIKRKTNAVAHATDANKRRANLVLTHSTDALKRKTNVLSHTTSSVLRQLPTRFHTTDALKIRTVVLTHSTDTFLRQRYTLVYSTDANKRKITVVSHSTDTRVSTAHGAHHSTDATIFSRRGVKHVLVNGVWYIGVAKFLIGSNWHIAQVKWFDGTDWHLTE